MWTRGCGASSSSPSFFFPVEGGRGSGFMASLETSIVGAKRCRRTRQGVARDDEVGWYGEGEHDRVKLTGLLGHTLTVSAGSHVFLLRFCRHRLSPAGNGIWPPRSLSPSPSTTVRSEMIGITQGAVSPKRSLTWHHSSSNVVIRSGRYSCPAHIHFTELEFLNSTCTVVVLHASRPCIRARGPRSRERSSWTSTTGCNLRSARQVKPSI